MSKALDVQLSAWVTRIPDVSKGEHRRKSEGALVFGGSSVSVSIEELIQQFLERQSNAYTTHSGMGMEMFFKTEFIVFAILSLTPTELHCEVVRNALFCD